MNVYPLHWLSYNQRELVDRFSLHYTMRRISRTCRYFSGISPDRWIYLCTRWAQAGLARLKENSTSRVASCKTSHPNSIADWPYRRAEWNEQEDIAAGFGAPELCRTLTSYKSVPLYAHKHSPRNMYRSDSKGTRCHHKPVWERFCKFEKGETMDVCICIYNLAESVIPRYPQA